MPFRSAIKGIAGPMPFIQLPTLLILSKLGVPSIRYMKYLQSRYGNIWSLSLTGFANTVTLLDAENVEFMLNSGFSNFERISDKSTIGKSWRLQAFLGKGIFAANGRSWEQQRHAARGYFTIKALESYVPVFDQQSKIAVGILAKHEKSQQPLDMQDIFFRYTLDSFGLMGFGFEFNSLISPPEFPALFDKLQLRVEETLRNPLDRAADDPEFRRQLAELDKTIYSMIETRKAENYHEKSDLLSRFMCLKDENGDPYNDEWLR